MKTYESQLLDIYQFTKREFRELVKMPAKKSNYLYGRALEATQKYDRDFGSYYRDDVKRRFEALLEARHGRDACLKWGSPQLWYLPEDDKYVTTWAADYTAHGQMLAQYAEYDVPNEAAHADVIHDRYN